MLRFRQIYVRKGTEWDIGEKKGCRALGRLRENRRWMPGSLCEGEMGMGGDAIRRFCGMRPVVTMVGGVGGGRINLTGYCLMLVTRRPRGRGWMGSMSRVDGGCAAVCLVPEERYRDYCGLGPLWSSKSFRNNIGGGEMC